MRMLSLRNLQLSLLAGTEQVGCSSAEDRFETGNVQRGKLKRHNLCYVIKIDPEFCF